MIAVLDHLGDDLVSGDPPTDAPIGVRPASRLFALGSEVVERFP
jgi:hypothetical protein